MINSNIGCIETVLRDKYGDKLTVINSNIDVLKLTTEVIRSLAANINIHIRYIKSNM